MQRVMIWEQQNRWKKNGQRCWPDQVKDGRPQDDKIKVIIAVGEAGYKFDLGKDAPDQFDVDLYELDSLKDLAEQFVEEGLYGEIPKALQYYIDYEAIARDLAVDYSPVKVSGCNFIYRTIWCNQIIFFSNLDIKG